MQNRNQPNESSTEDSVERLQDIRASTSECDSAVIARGAEAAIREWRRTTWRGVAAVRGEYKLQDRLSGGVIN